MLSALLLLALPVPQVDTLASASLVAARDRTIRVQTLEGEALAGLSSHSAADALRYFSGVQVKDYGGVGGLKTVNVRSLGAQHTAVCYNGVRLSGASNGQVDLGRFSLDNVASMSLYNGQKSDVLQTATDFAAASAVYLEQKVPDRTEARFRVRGGSWGTVQPSVYAGWKTPAGIRASVSADALSSHGRYRFTYHLPSYDTTAVRQNGDVLALRLESLFAWRGLKVNAYGYLSGRGLPGPVVRRVSDQYATWDRQRDADAFIQASWRGRPNDRLSLQGVVKYGHNALRYTSNPSRTGAAPPVDNTWRQDELYGSAAAAWYPLPWLSAGSSADVRYAGLESDVYGFGGARRTLLLWAANCQGRVAGLKVHPSVLLTHVRDDVGAQTTRHTRVTPAVFLFYDWEWLTLKAFYKEIFRLPSFNDLFYTAAGLRSLRPEYTRQLDFGAGFDRWGLSASAEVYASEVWDKIVAMPTQSQFSWSVVNYGRVRGYGLTASLGYAIERPRWAARVLLKYAYEVAQDFTDPSSPWFRGQIPYTPWHSGSLIAGGRFGAWSLSASVLYTGVRYRSVANLAEERMDPWTTTDLSVGRSFRLGKTLLAVSLEVNNIFGQYYDVVPGYPMPGRNAFLKICVTI